MFELDELLKNHDVLNIADNFKIDEIVKRFKIVWTYFDMSEHDEIPRSDCIFKNDKTLKNHEILKIMKVWMCLNMSEHVLTCLNMFRLVYMTGCNMVCLNMMQF